MTRLAVFLLFLVFPFARAQERIAPAIRPYTSCAFDDGLRIVSLDALPATPMVRTVETPDGEKQITMLEGERIMLAYPDEDFYANVKAEQLDLGNYPREKADLIAQLGPFVSDGKARIEPPQPPLQGFEVHGLNRLALEGGVLGIYLLFDDKQAVVTTIYFLNGEPGQRRFQSLPGYARLRDRFLAAYAGCVRTNQGASKKL